MTQILTTSKNRNFYLFFLKLSVMLIPGAIIAYLFKNVTSLKFSLLQLKPVNSFYEILMYVSQWFLSLFGFNAHVIYTDKIYYYPVYALQIDNGSYLFLGFPCLGIMLMLPFAALIIAYTGKPLTKLWFIAVGCLVIQIFNIFRISLLTVLLSYYNIPVDKGIKIFGIYTVSHHDMFNFVIFLVIFLMFIIWVKKFGKETVQEQNSIKQEIKVS